MWNDSGVHFSAQITHRLSCGGHRRSHNMTSTRWRQYQNGRCDRNPRRVGHAANSIHPDHPPLAHRSRKFSGLADSGGPIPDVLDWRAYMAAFLFGVAIDQIRDKTTSPSSGPAAAMAGNVSGAASASSANAAASPRPAPTAGSIDGSRVRSIFRSRRGPGAH